MATQEVDDADRARKSNPYKQILLATFALQSGLTIDDTGRIRNAICPRRSGRAEVWEEEVGGPIFAKCTARCLKISGGWLLGEVFDRLMATRKLEPPKPRPAPKRERANPDDIRRLLELIAVPDAVFEIRALDVSKRGTVSGYYDAEHIGEAVKAAISVSGVAVGVYITVNPVDPSLQARAMNRLRGYTPKGESVKDENILRRRFVMLDFDYDRPTGISATDEEHDLALDRMRECADALEAEGITLLLVGDSGNGGHILLLVDLLNDDECLALIKRLFEALKAKFGASPIKFDVANSNAARIWKMYGTLAAKGDHTAERPHRVAPILALRTESDSFEDLIVTREQLEALATKWAPPAKEQKSQRNDTGHRGQQWQLTEAEIADALTYISDRDDRETWLHMGMALKSGFGEAGRPLWDDWLRGSSKFDPADQERTWDGFTADGGINLGTLIHLAKKGGWPGTKRQSYPLAAATAENNGDGNLPASVRDDHGRVITSVYDLDNQPAMTALRVYNADDFYAATADLENVKWIWDRIAPSCGIIGVFGDPESGKSTFLRSFALSSVDGLEFLERKCERSNVLHLDLADEKLSHRRSFKNLGWGSGSGMKLISTDSLVGTPNALEMVENAVTETRSQVAIVDMMADLLKFRDMNDYANAKAALRGLRVLSQRTQALFFVPHHTPKAIGPDADVLKAGLGSQAIVGAFDLRMAVRRRAKDLSTLVMSNGKIGGEPLTDEVVLIRNPETEWITLGGKWGDHRADYYLDKVVAFLTANTGERMGATRIAEEMNLNPGWIRGSLAKAAKAGVLKREKVGRGFTYWVGDEAATMPETKPATGKQEKLFKGPGGRLGGILDP